MRGAKCYAYFHWLLAGILSLLLIYRPIKSAIRRVVGQENKMASGKFFPIFGPKNPEPVAKKPKIERSEEERKAVKKQYEQTKRKREFQTHWLKEFQRLEHTEKDGMTCKICKVFDTSGAFVSGTFSNRKDSLTTYEESEIHKFHVLKEKNKKALIETSSAFVVQTLYFSIYLRKSMQLVLFFLQSLKFKENSYKCTPLVRYCQLGVSPVNYSDSDLILTNGLFVTSSRVTK